MTVIKAMFGWFLRQGFVLFLIVAAIAFHQFVWPTISEGTAKTAISTEMMSVGDISAKLESLKEQTITEIEASKNDIRFYTGNVLSAKLSEKNRQFKDVERRLDQNDGVFASIRPTAIIEKETLKLKRKKLLAEIELLEAAIKKDVARTALLKIVYPSKGAVKAQKTLWENANTNVRTFNRLRGPERAVENLRYDRAKTLTNVAKNERQKFYDKVESRKKGIEKTKNALKKFDQSKAVLSQVENEVKNRLDEYVPDVGKKTIQTLLKQALIILAGIIALPFIIRTIFYFVLAPFAERRTSIRIKGLDSGGAMIPLTEHSRISIPITLGQGEELLVRQNYLQSSSLTGKKSTRWLLDYRHFLSSIASGLSFLTRIRGEGEMTTISAVHDNMAELNEVMLPNGSACVLHPRALVAVVQPMGKTMKISSHWRLFSLNAWLTFQLRYLVFHGPVRLIIKGGRGIRIERAERGRIFGQDQLVGFSTDISYSVIRTETFAPYFFGLEQLFKDKVEQGSGILIIEEAPFSSREGRGIRRGLEGALDAGMKAFGL